MYCVALKCGKVILNLNIGWKKGSNVNSNMKQINELWQKLSFYTVVDYSENVSCLKPGCFIVFITNIVFDSDMKFSISKGFWQTCIKEYNVG